MVFSAGWDYKGPSLLTVRISSVFEFYLSVCMPFVKRKIKEILLMPMRKVTTVGTVQCWLSTLLTLQPT